MLLEKARLAELRATFAEISGKDQKIGQDEFEKALGLADPYFNKRLFDIFDYDKSGMISQQEFLDSVEQLIDGSPEDKLRFVFQIHDEDGNGRIEKAELIQILEFSLDRNRLSFSHEQIESLVDAMFREADLDQNNDISYEEFKAIIDMYPDLLESMSIGTVSWLKPRTNIAPMHVEEKVSAQKTSVNQYVANNWVTLLFLAAYILVNSYFFCNAVQTYEAAGANIYVQIARGCGAMLNFNGALILVPMMRHFLTRLRKTAVNHFIPIDKSVEFHKLVGHVMFAAAVVHTTAHFLNYTTLNSTFLQSLFATKAGLTGFFWLLIFIAMWVTALPQIRKGGYFKLFYLVHLGYVLWLAIGLFHGPNFWRWLLIPGIAFAIEQVIRYFKTKEAASAIHAYLLPSKVLGLEINRPDNFHFQAGDYLFLKVPVISKHEWHPFTISSAPEDKLITFHIRAVGSWTGAIYEHFKKLNQQFVIGKQEGRSINMMVHLDGPYGTPSSRIFASKYAILIGAGIGVTPFASILKSILNRKQNYDLNMRLEKVYFYWINRGQHSFEWFTELMSNIEAEDTEGFFDINIYLTGTQNKSDMKSSALFMAMDMLHTHTAVDLITGLKTKTQLGRPDWNPIFAKIKEAHPSEKVDVYFCGSPGLSKLLKKLSSEYQFHYHKENF